MDILSLPKRQCAMCKIEIEYSEYIRHYTPIMFKLRTKFEILDKVWNNIESPIYCEDCI